MPSSMIFAGLVVIWLLILVPAVARHRQEVARPSVAALSGRVLERPRRRQNLEVDVMDEVERSRPVAVKADREDERPRVPAARAAGAGVTSAVAEATREPDEGGPDGSRADHGRAVSVDDRPADLDAEVEDGYAGHDAACEDDADDRYEDDSYEDDRYDDGDGPDGDDRRWERPPPRYRPGRGGFDPEAAALTARARYAVRQRVVLGMLVAALITGVVAAVSVPGMWWLHAAIDLSLVGYLVYLRRQVRMEEAIRDRRAARMAGSRRSSAAEDPELADRAHRGADGSRDRAEPEVRPVAAHDEREADPAEEDEPDDLRAADDLQREEPERVPGTGAPLKPTAAGDDDLEPAPALPRLQPAPPPALPAGTALVEADEEHPDMYDLEGPTRPDYRRAAGE